MAASVKPTTDNPIALAESSQGEPEFRRSWLKLMALAVLVAALVSVVYFSPLRQYLGDLREVSRRLRGFGTLAPLVLTAGVAILVAVGFPRLVFCVLAGMTLGFWPGLLWAQLGTLLGNYILFLLVRFLGRHWAARMISRRPNLQHILQKRGIMGVVLARQLPLPGVVINMTCALLPLSQLDFLLGTIVGQLPQAIPSTLIGAGLLQASLSKSIAVIALAVVLSALAWAGLRYFSPRISRQGD